MIVPLFVGREKSVARARRGRCATDKQILLATQMNAADDDPEPDAIYELGTLATVLQLLKLPDGTVKVLVEGASARPDQRLHRHATTIYEAEAEALAETRSATRSRSRRCCAR